MMRTSFTEFPIKNWLNFILYELYRASIRRSIRLDSLSSAWVLSAVLSSTKDSFHPKKNLHFTCGRLQRALERSASEKAIGPESHYD